MLGAANIARAIHLLNAKIWLSVFCLSIITKTESHNIITGLRIAVDSINQKWLDPSKQ